MFSLIHFLVVGIILGIVQHAQSMHIEISGQVKSI